MSKLPKVEKEKSIRFILAEVDLQPLTFFQFIRSFFRDFGLRYVFLGMGEVLFIVATLLTGIGTWHFFDLLKLVKAEIVPTVYFFVFISSPICYALLYYGSVWKELLQGTFELKMTLRLTLKELMLIRMLVFSSISLVLSVVSNVVIWQVMQQEVSLIRLLSVSFSSLFIFAIVQLWLEKKLNIRYGYLLTGLGWLLVCGGLLWQKEQVEQLLIQLPLLIVAGLGLLSLCLFIWLLRVNYFTKKEGMMTYAST